MIPLLGQAHQRSTERYVVRRGERQLKNKLMHVPSSPIKLNQIVGQDIGEE
jgi:hypothetical protein